MKRILRSAIAGVWAALLAASSLVTGQESPAARPARLHRLELSTPGELRELLQYTGRPLPLVSAHRGGPERGYPENCLETFEHTLRHTFALLEVDPRYTKDGAIVLHHDPTLDRTTTGRGRLADHTLEEVKALRLKDPAGEVTPYQVPTLGEALEWARGKAVLVLDQKDVPVAARVRKIEEHKAEAYAMLIVYSYKEAAECHALNPHIMMEVMVPSQEKIAEFSQTGVPWRNVIAFVGHVPPEDKALYAAIHAQGTSCLIGTSRNLDRRVIQREVTDMKELEPKYRAFLERGADIIETDIPSQLGPLLYRSLPAPETKARFFRQD
jgi:glycerophosphoryl diester phosphodiesterase